MQVPGRPALEPRSLGDQAKAEACLHDTTGPPGGASWLSMLAQSALGVDSHWGDGSGAWLKPPPGGQLSQGPKPLACAQFPEATPPSADSQGRTFRAGQASPLPDPVPWKQPDLTTSVSPVPCLTGPTSHCFPFSVSQSCSWEAGLQTIMLAPLAPWSPPVGQPMHKQISSTTQRPKCRHRGHRTSRGGTESPPANVLEDRASDALARARMSRSRGGRSLHHRGRAFQEQENNTHDCGKSSGQKTLGVSSRPTAF